MTDEDHVAVSKEVSDLGRHAISCLYDGGNCERVTHPPFTFSGLELGGVRELTLIGYRNEKEAARQTLRRPGPAAKLRVEPADWGIPLQNDGVDFLFLYVHLEDAAGASIYEGRADVCLTVKGGHVIGHSRFSTEAGVAPFLVSADQGASSLTIQAESEGLASDALTISY